MTIFLALLMLMGFLIVHAIKLIRFYLILVEEDISFGKFVPAYFASTFVNLIIPFKLGEIFRIGLVKYLAKSLKTGFFSVLVDRFFDTLAIVFILFPYQLFIKRELSFPVLILFAFVVIVLFTYIVFKPTYLFLNRYIIVKRRSRGSLAALSALETVNEWYEYVKRLVMGRYGMLILFSFAAWACEMLVIAGFYKVMGYEFSVGDFGGYIEAVLTGGEYLLKNEYTAVSIIIIFAAAVISCIASALHMRKRKV